jgi:hypothetical protein
MFLKMLNDKEMDVLIGRYAKGAAKGTPVEHPDADELNAFAEGALPPSARQRYLSHFADCDDCRKLVSQLAVTTGAGVEVRIPAFEPVAEPWWKKLSAVFAIPTLRYAAFGVVLLAVGGIAFLSWRQLPQRNAELVAQHQPQTSPVEAVKPASTQEPEVTRNNENTQPSSNTAIPQPTVSSTSDQDKSGLTTVSPLPPPKPADALAAKESAPVVAGAARSDDAPRAQSTPSYAPAPTETYRMESRERAQQSPGPGGPRRNESFDKYKTVDRAQSGDFAKGRDEDRNRAAANQPTTENKVEASKSAPPSSGVAAASRRGVGELRAEARKSAGTGSSSEEAPETRSVGGRKFKRQGNAWIDSKLKSSMSVRTVGRGSEEFDKLDSGLRSIAKQLSGEIVVVWKGKAYRIR